MGIVVLTMLVTLFIPLHYKMYDMQQARKQALHASAAMLEGAKQQASAGTYHIDGIAYHWVRHGAKICVTYETDKRHERCVS